MSAFSGPMAPEKQPLFIVLLDSWTLRNEKSFLILSTFPLTPFIDGLKRGSLIFPQFAKRHILLKKILNDFTITDIQKSLATTLSGGERHRLEIARCIACQPKFILLDEPFARIDPLAVQDLQGLIHYLKTQI